MKIPFSDLEDEIKDGYYVDSMMKCCWASQTEVLEWIDFVCQKYKIQYFAEWGTMLGAVRHHGIIPWDDDVDITMKRPDYRKFLKVAEQELPEGYHIITYYNNEDYWDLMARVVNTEYFCTDKVFLEKHHYFPFSTGIDIFPMDYAPKDKNDAEILKKLVDEVKGVADSYGEGELTKKEFQQALKYLEKLCKTKIDRTGNIRVHLYELVESLYSMYKEEESDELVLMPIWLKNGKQAYDKKYFVDAVRLPFGHTTIPVPAAYDFLLKKKYGNYMNMVRKGGSHNYPYYKKQIDIVTERGVTFSKFQYANRVIREQKETKNRIELKLEDLVVLENAHKSIFKLLYINDYETAKQLLLKCQECAISVGNRAEDVLIDCEVLISTLEEYCELIFQLHQMLEQGEVLNSEGVFSILQQQLQLIKNEYGKEYQKKKKIVFIIDKVTRWKSIESVWRAAKEDKGCTVLVIAVPYYHKNLDGSILDECYEKELFPEEIEVADYKKYDLEQYHPDVIYINNPYDEYNYFTSVHPYFYSSNLVKFTDKLVYIPWFLITELTREDERGWQSMQHFVTMPGVVNADKVIVQSEQMKTSYVEYLTDWAGEDTRSIWEEKISGIGSPLMDSKNINNEIEMLDIPEEWKNIIYKKDGSRKKVLLYNISGSGFVEHGEKAVTKLESVLNIVKESSEEIVMLWYADKEMEKVLRKSYPDLAKAYERMLEEYQKGAWGIYTSDLDSKMAVLMSDAYYGDVCALSQAMVIAKKPVMIQNFKC